MVEKNYSKQQSKIKHCSVDATAHYSYDWSQNVQVPSSDQQISQTYFLTARKNYLFGIQDEAIKKQINYVLDENELIDKGSNGTLSLVFDGIKRFNKGEIYLKLTCDNTVGQNKNNTTLWFCLYLVIAGYYKTIELDFMIAGHTKFSVDGNFGLIKKLYRKSTVHCKEDFVGVVKKSSSAGLNKVQCYEDGKGFQYLDFKGSLEKCFDKLPNLAKYHHFHFSSTRLGVVRVQEFADSPFIDFDLLKTKGKRWTEIREETRNLWFPILAPEPLSYQRQEYLYQNVRSLVVEEFRDVVCPKPV